MKHKSHWVHESTTCLNSEEDTPSNSPVAEPSTSWNRRGKESHSEKHSRHPWQASNTLRNSVSNAFGDQKLSSCQRSGSRKGDPEGEAEPGGRVRGEWGGTVQRAKHPLHPRLATPHTIQHYNPMQCNTIQYKTIPTQATSTVHFIINNIDINTQKRRKSKVSWI